MGLVDLALMISINKHVAIKMETLKIDSVYSLKKIVQVVDLCKSLNGIVPNYQLC